MKVVLSKCNIGYKLQWTHRLWGSFTVTIRGPKPTHCDIGRIMREEHTARGNLALSGNKTYMR